MNDLIYTVDRVTQTTECKVQNCKKDFMRITDKVLSMYPEHIRYFYKFIASYRCEGMIKDEYIGRSVCSPEDRFDERQGRDVARTKAIIKRENAFQSALETIFNDIDTLMEVNISINRDDVLDKHLGNMCDLLENGKSLAHIRGYLQEDVDDPDNRGDLDGDITPHCCSLCGSTFINYCDDIRYDEHEKEWKVLPLDDGDIIEICPSCVNTIKRLT